MSDKDPSDVRQRGVRSFVLRAGRATAGQQRALAQLWPKYGVEFSPARLDLQTLFGRAAPRMLEIGFGAGEALLEFAGAHPEFDCIGIEVHRPGVGRLLLGAEAAQLSNLRVICHDAVEVLQHQLPPRPSLSCTSSFPIRGRRSDITSAG
jgi:tRNA (guanine-N7-)-methyltransferase